jgi:hypothetical protein
MPQPSVRSPSQAQFEAAPGPGPLQRQMPTHSLDTQESGPAARTIGAIEGLGDPLEAQPRRWELSFRIAR